MQRRRESGGKGSAARWLSMAMLGALCCGARGSCGWSENNTCKTDDCEAPFLLVSDGSSSCEIPALDGQQPGACIPYVDAGWHTALVQIALPGPTGLHCPASAPNAGMVGKEILEPDDNPGESGKPGNRGDSGDRGGPGRPDQSGGSDESGDGEARHVIACSVNPLPTCPSATYACVPWEPDYPPCVLQTGFQLCPDAYPVTTRVEQRFSGDLVTVCCLDPREPR